MTNVHNSMAKIMTSYFFRYSGEWDNMSDEERFQQAVDWDREKAKQNGLEGVYLTHLDPL